MLDFVIASTANAESARAGEELATRVAEHRAAPPDAVILFASPTFDPEPLLETFLQGTGARQLVGCTSAGEFTQAVQGTGLACCVALWSEELTFQAALGGGVSADHSKAARTMAEQLTSRAAPPDHFLTGIVFVDALAGHTEPFLDELTARTAGTYQFAGGGSGDNAAFTSTPVFIGSRVVNDAAVVLGIASPNPLAVGVGHGWSPRGKRMRVTESGGNTLSSLNGLPAREAVEAYAEATGQVLDQNDPLPFFLHNIIGMETAAGYKLRVPLGIRDDGSILMAAAVPQDTIVRFMSTDFGSSVAAARAATAAGLEQLAGERPAFALFFDCVATRLRMGDEGFRGELAELADGLNGVPFLGFNTHGQVARVAGQFSGFHNCTAVVCMFP